MKDKQYKSSTGINSQTSQGHEPIDIASFNQSCLASDTQDLGDMDTLHPVTEDTRFFKESNSPTEKLTA